MKRLLESISIERFFYWLSKAFESYTVISPNRGYMLSFQPIRSKGETNCDFHAFSPPPLIFAYIFPRWVMSPCFIPFSNVCNPSCASQRLYVLGCLATFACFPTLGIDLMSVPSLRFGCIFCLEVWLPFGVIHFCCVFRGGVGCSGWGWGLG